MGLTSPETTTVEVHRVAVGQPTSPPPLRVAVLLTEALATAGVTESVKTTCAPAGRPAGTRQLTDCPTAVHPGGRVPSAKFAGTLSVTVASAVVGAVPSFVTVIV